MSGVSVSGLVRDSRLHTTFRSQSDLTTHSYFFSDTDTNHRPVQITNVWLRNRQLGKHSSGNIWLESCVEGHNFGQLRAVKEVAKFETDSLLPIDYTRELEGIAKFSQDCYVSWFVKSDGWYENDDSIFITMEYLPLGDLHDYLEKPWTESEARIVTTQLAEGLAFMHNNQLVHQELEPQNVLVVESGPAWWVKISAFGFSKRFEGSTSARTPIDDMAYLAPELTDLRGFFDTIQRSYTSAVDIWALGQIAFRLMTNTLAFSEVDVFSYVTRREGFPEALLRHVNASVSCIDFIEGAMRPFPSERLTADQCLDCAWMEEKDSNDSRITILVSMKLDDLSSRPRTFSTSEDEEPDAPTTPDTPRSYSTEHWVELNNGIADMWNRISAPEVTGSTTTWTRNPAPQMDSPKAKWTISPAQDTYNITSELRKSLDIETESIVRWTTNAVQTSHEVNGLRGTDPVSQTAVAHIDSPDLSSSSDKALSIAFSPDSTRMASGMSNGTIGIWCALTGALIGRLQGHEDEILSLEFFPNGALIISISCDGTIGLWDAVNVNIIDAYELRVQAQTFSKLRRQRSIVTAAFSKDCTRIAVGLSDGTLRISDTRKGAKPHTLHRESKTCLSIVFSPDGRRLASASRDGTVGIWDAENEHILYWIRGSSGPNTPVAFSSMAFGPDSVRMVLGSPDGSVGIWDPMSQTRLRLLQHNDTVCSVAFSPDGNYIAAGSRVGGVRIWDTYNDSILHTLQSDVGVSLAFSPSGTHVAVRSRDSEIQVLNVFTGLRKI